MDLLTLTMLNMEPLETKEEIEDPNQVLFPKTSTSRALNFNKPTLFLTSRVHCGETCASFFLQGMLDFIKSFSEQA